MQIAINNSDNKLEIEVEKGIFCIDEDRYKQELLLREIEEELPLESSVNMGCIACSNEECKLHIDRVEEAKKKNPYMVVVPF